MSINEWLLFFLSYNLLIFVGSQRLFKLAGVDSWKSLIPVYNIVKHLEIINRPKWWVILVFYSSYKSSNGSGNLGRIY